MPINRFKSIFFMFTFIVHMSFQAAAPVAVPFLAKVVATGKAILGIKSAAATATTAKAAAALKAAAAVKTGVAVSTAKVAAGGAAVKALEKAGEMISGAFEKTRMSHQSTVQRMDADTKSRMSLLGAEEKIRASSGSINFGMHEKKDISPMTSVRGITPPPSKLPVSELLKGSALKGGPPPARIIGADVVPERSSMRIEFPTIRPPVNHIPLLPHVKSPVEKENPSIDPVQQVSVLKELPAAQNSTKNRPLELPHVQTEQEHKLILADPTLTWNNDTRSQQLPKPIGIAVITVKGVIHFVKWIKGVLKELPKEAIEKADERGLVDIVYDPNNPVHNVLHLDRYQNNVSLIAENLQRAQEQNNPAIDKEKSAGCGDTNPKAQNNEGCGDVKPKAQEPTVCGDTKPKAQETVTCGEKPAANSTTTTCGDGKAELPIVEKAIHKLPGQGNDWVKLKGDQGWRDSKGRIWKKDMKHRVNDSKHWDVSDRNGNKIMEVDYDGNEIWPNGPKNKNK